MAPKGPIELKIKLIHGVRIDGGPAVLALEDDQRRGALLHLTPETASDLATAALKCLLVQPSQPPEPKGPEIQAIDKQIQVSGIGWLDPGRADIQPGHSVLLLEVGGAQMTFSAPTEAWSGTLAKLVDQKSRQSSN